MINGGESGSQKENFLKAEINDIQYKVLVQSILCLHESLYS